MSKGSSPAEEADALMKSAKKAKSTSITKWNADWDKAADLYEKAAKLYAVGPSSSQQRDKVREAWLSASEAHDKAKNLFFAARALETLANFLRDDAAYIKTDAGRREASELYTKAGQMYALDRKPERQGAMLQRVAQLVPDTDYRAASASIEASLNTLETSDNYHYTPDIYRSWLLLLVRGSHYLEAIHAEKRAMRAFKQLNQPGAASKAGLEIVVLALALGDWVIAEREFRELQGSFGFDLSKEQDAAYGLMAAYQERDEEMLTKCGKVQVLSFIIPDISRIAKRLKLSGVRNAPPPKPEAKVVGSGGEQGNSDGSNDDNESSTSSSGNEKSVSSPTSASVPPAPSPPAPEDDDEDLR